MSPVVARQARLAVRLAAGGLLAGLVAVPFLALLLLVEAESEELEAVDRAVADGLNAWALERPAAVRVLDLLEQVLAPWSFRVAVVVAAVLLWRAGARRMATWALVTMALGGALGVLFKELVQRARPTFEEPVATASFWSFPSGHALNAFLGSAVLLMVALPYLRGAAARALAWVATGAAVLVTSFDRVALGVHYLSDVLAGWAVAGAVIAGTAAAFGTHRPGRHPVAPRRDNVPGVRAYAAGPARAAGSRRG